MKKTEKNFRIQFLYRPGMYLTDGKMAVLVHQLRETAATCFEEIPEYQAMKGGRDELKDKILAVAWNNDGTIAGFCSCVELQVPGVGKVLHLGLTCVRPEARSGGLTMILTKKVVLGYVLRNRLIGKLWITNCAAVLSSLGSVSLNFEGVYPSPFDKPVPTKKHMLIAETIDRYYRDKIYINDYARFDSDYFVFRKSVKDTVFQKSAHDRRYYHRMEQINRYYGGLMNFDEGDEVLQVGFVTSLTAIVHLYKRRKLMETMKKELRASA